MNISTVGRPANQLMRPQGQQPNQRQGGIAMPQQMQKQQFQATTARQPGSMQTTQAQPQMMMQSTQMGQPQMSQALGFRDTGSFGDQQQEVSRMGTTSAPGGGMSTTRDLSKSGLQGVGWGLKPNAYSHDFGYGPIFMWDTQGPLQQMQGYQQGLLSYLESVLDTGADSSILGSIIGQGHIDQNQFNNIFSILQGSGQGLVDAAGQINPMLQEGLLSDSLTQGLFSAVLGNQATGQNGIIDRAQSMVDNGLFSPSQLSQLLGASGRAGQGADALASGGLFNSGEESRFNDIFNQVFGNASGASESGGVTATQESDFLNRLNQAGDAASGVSQTGGMDSGALDQLRSMFGGQSGRLSETASRGGLTEEEYNQNIASARQNVMDMGRASAANTFNASNFTGNPFAAMALNHDTNIQAGKAAGQARADANRYQADSRMNAERQLTDLFGAGAGLESDVAGGRRQGAGMLGNLASQAGDFYLGQGGQRLEGIGQQGNLASQLQDFLRTDAQGRVTGLEQQGNYADQLRNIFGDNASGYQQGIESILQSGDFLKGLEETDNRGRLDAFESLMQGSGLMNELAKEAARYQSQTMPSFLSELFQQSSQGLSGGGEQNTNLITQILKLLQG